MLQDPRSFMLNWSPVPRALSSLLRILVLSCVVLGLPEAWSQSLQPVTPILQFPSTQVGSTSQQSISLQVVGAPISITSFSFADSEGAIAEFAAGTVTGCVVDGSTQNPAGTICIVPVTFQPAYPGLRRVPLQAITSGGTLYFGLNGTGQAAQVSLTPGNLSSIAGTGAIGSAGNNGAAATATLNHPARTAVDYQGNVFIADAGNNAIREIVASTGNIILVAGNGTACATPSASCGDNGPATSASLLNPSSVAVDAAGNLYLADSGDNRIRRVDASTGVITTVAGNGGATFAGDGGQATAASFGNPQQVIVDATGNLYIAATGDNEVRYVSASTGLISTMAGDGTICSPSTASCGDGGTASGGGSKLNAPTGLALDPSGDLYIADAGDNRVRRIDAGSRQISTVAGTGTAGYTGDGAAATSAELNGIAGVDIDAAGNLYLADAGNAAIRLVLSLTGTIVTIAGNGTACASATAACGDGGVSAGADLISPQNAALDSFGNLYIADSGENRIRMVYVVQPTLTFASVTVGHDSPSNPINILVTNIGNQSATANAPASGTNPTFNGHFFDNTEISVCPLLMPGSPAATLYPGYGCNYAIDFHPEMAGVNTGSMVLTGSALSNPSATETVLLTGTGIQIVEGNMLSSLNTSPAYGDQVTFTDIVAQVDGVGPTGNVTFYNGSTQIGVLSIPYLGVSTFTIASLPVGTASITAVYSGDTNFAASISNTVVEMVGSVATTATTTTIASTVNPSSYGQATTFNATVGYPAGGAVPTGSVTFYSPGAGTAINLQAAPGATTASQALNLAAGTYSVSLPATAGGGLYAGWNSAANPSTNNLWTDRYGIELCATCTGLVADLAGDPGYGTDAAALSAFQAAATLNLTVDPQAQGQTTGNPYTFTLTAPQAVSFYVPDGPFANGAFTDTSAFADDSGGLSLSITPLTPLATASLDASGVAAFSTSTLPIGTSAIQAVYAGDTTYVGSSSAVLMQTVTRAAVSATLTTTNPSLVSGQVVGFTDTIPSVNGIYPSGTVTFYNGSAVLGNGPLTNGVATLTTSALPIGTDTIQAQYGGDTNFQANTSNSVTETVIKGSGPDALSASNSTSSLGQAVTFTDTIPIAGGNTPTGMVTFYNGSATIGTATVNGSSVAMFTTALLPAGTDSVTAVYSGDSGYAPGASNPVSVTVSKGNGTSALSASIVASFLGQAVTFTDTVSGVPGFVPTGTVTFYNGSVALGTGMLNASGVATLVTTALPVGNDSIKAVYAGDSNYSTVTSNNVTVMVAKENSTATLRASTATTAFGRAVTFTNTVTGAAGFVPTGTVTFYNGSVALGTGMLNASGVATLVITSLPVGSDTITAVSSGDGNYFPATSNAVTVIVARGSSASTLTASTAATVFGQPVTFTDTVSGVSGVIPAGTVTFYNGSSALGTGTLNASGIATLLTASLPVGYDTVTAVYGGDGNYTTGSSGPVSVAVAAAPILATTVDLLAASPSSSIFGQTVAFTDSISAGAGATPTGIVTFYEGTDVLGSASVDFTGVATLNSATLSVGTHSIHAVYSGDSNYSAETSNTVDVNIGTGDFAIAATPAYQIADPGAATNYTVSLSGVAVPFEEPVVLSATGLPKGASVSFNPGSVTPDAGPTTVMMTITTAGAPSGLARSQYLQGIACALLLLPLLGLRNLRSKLPIVHRGVLFGLILLTGVAGLGAAVSLTGCGSSQFTQNYTITVTGISGGIQHSTTVKLGIR